MTDELTGVSLVCTTRGRTAELRRLVASIEESTYDGEIELLVVNQGDDPDVSTAASTSSQLSIQYLTSERGASRGRNVGLRVSRLPVITFPDDDCWYNPSALETAVSYLEQGAVAVVGRQLDPSSARSLLRFPTKPTEVTPTNVLRTGIEFGIFVRREVFERIGEFDVGLGTGSDGPFQAGEGTDLLLRLLRLGPVVYRPEIIIYHPTESLTPEKAEPYGLGIGYVLRRHDVPVTSVASVLLRRIAKAAILMVRGRRSDARLALGWARGVAAGYRRGKKQPQDTSTW